MHRASRFPPAHNGLTLPLDVCLLFFDDGQQERLDAIYGWIGFSHIRLDGDGAAVQPGGSGNKGVVPIEHRREMT